MAAGPAVTALILTAITFALVPRISIGGSAYEQLMWGKDFQTGTVSPSLYIIEISSQVQRLTVLASSNKDFAAVQTDIGKRQADYERAYGDWVNRLTDAEAKRNLTASHAAATEYFRLYQQQLLPAVRANRDADAATLLESTMQTALAQHRAGAQAAAERVQLQVEAQEAEVAAQSRRQAVGTIAVTLLIVAASIALGVTVLRSITDRVRRLNEVATVELPQVLEDVKRAAHAGEEIPSLPAPRGEGGDELAAAALGFNSVVATAVDLAAEQSRLRRATSQMFVNLGRRNHKLLSRTLTYITQLESDERDPATLQNLFRLDHLTTRMRRHAESLLVLAGSPPLRTWSRPVPVADVLRAALSEIETYDRVDIKELQPVEVRGVGVSDLAHLLAELLENATAFSPPQTRVRVLGRTDAEGYTILVVDEGIGMSPHELQTANELISRPEESGFFGDSRMLGLGVVGRLAARHGFKVNLTSSPVGGVVAWVTLPTSALAPRRGTTDTESASGGAAAAQVTSAENLENLPRQPQPGSANQPTGVKPADAVAADVEPAARADQDQPLPEEWSQPAPEEPQTANGRVTSHGLASTALPLRPAGEERTADAADATSEDEALVVEAEPGSEDVAPAAAQDVGPVEVEPTGQPVVEGPVVESEPQPTAEAESLPDENLVPEPEPEPALAPGADAELVAEFMAHSISVPEPEPEPQSEPVVEPEPAAATTSAAEPRPAPAVAPDPVTVEPEPVADAALEPEPEPAPDAELRPASEEPAPVVARQPREPAAAGQPRPLKRRVRGAQLPDTGEPLGGAPSARPDRTAQSVRGALHNFSVGRRSAAEVTHRDNPATGPLRVDGPAGAQRETAAHPPQQPSRSGVPPVPGPASSEREQKAKPAGRLPRRVRGAQLPETDLPSSAPAPGRSAAEVRAALSNFVAGRRAAEHED